MRRIIIKVAHPSERLIKIKSIVPTMKWYDRINVVVWSIILTPLFIIFSFITSKWNLQSWPDFFMFMAGASLNVLVVLLIIENSVRKERKRRWENIKLFAYSQILEKLRYIGYHVCHTTFMVYLEPLDINREKIEREGLDDAEAAFILRCLAYNIFKYYIFLYDVSKIYFESRNKDDPMEMHIKALTECFDNISHEINEYKAAIVPRIISFSDDVEVNLALLRFEEAYAIIHYRKDFLNRYNPSFSFGKDNDKKYIALGPNFVDPAFISLAYLLRSSADLYELIQRKMTTVPEIGLIEETMQESKHQLKELGYDAKHLIKYWWLPPDCWD